MCSHTHIYMYIYKREDFELSMFSSLLNESIFNIPNLLLGILSKKKKLVNSFQTYKVV
jgi:hypothetical protein